MTPGYQNKAKGRGHEISPDMKVSRLLRQRCFSSLEVSEPQSNTHDLSNSPPISDKPQFLSKEKSELQRLTQYVYEKSWRGNMIRRRNRGSTHGKIVTQTASSAHNRSKTMQTEGNYFEPLETDKPNQRRSSFSQHYLTMTKIKQILPRPPKETLGLMKTTIMFAQTAKPIIVHYNAKPNIQLKTCHHQRLLSEIPKHQNNRQRDQHREQANLAKLKDRYPFEVARQRIRAQRRPNPINPSPSKLVEKMLVLDGWEDTFGFSFC